MRSQVLPYLREMSDGFTFELITYEQDDASIVDRAELGPVRLRRLRYHKRPWLLAKPFDLAVGVTMAVWSVVRGGARLIHARSHVAATVALIASVVTRRPFIFDMRGFLGDEFVEAGAWRSGGLRHRLVGWLEGVLLRASTAVVVLTERARTLLREEPRSAHLVRGKEIVVVPCCVELDRFSHHSDAPSDSLAYVGSLGTWYLLDEMLRFFWWYRSLRPRARFVIANAGQHDLLHARLEGSDLAGHVTVATVDHREIPAFLSQCAAGIVLLREGRSKLASSPIKVAEYLAAGLAVVVNQAVGDMPQLLRQYRAGVVLGGLEDRHLATGAEELAALLDDSAVRARARRLAEERFDVRRGAREYAALYGRILADRADA